MADEAQLARLKQGVKTWNIWRLKGANDVDLSRVDLSRADLRGAYLREVCLVGANLSGANLRGADLRGASLQGADLSGAKLRRAKLSWADLSRADLSEAKLSRANLSGAKLFEAKLSGADLNGLDLNGANLNRLDLNGANLSGANLSGANLSGANLSEANLSEANLSEADLRESSLARAQALDTNFTKTILTEACIDEWHTNAATKLDGVVCTCIYLKRGEKERRPSDPSQTFAPGEFTKLFQKAQETVDLIFRNGVDWKAFAYAFQQLQIENEADELAIASIENKGDGVVVIRIKAAPTADKPKLHGDFMQVYEVVHKTLEAQYQARLEDKDKHINQLFALVQSSQLQNSEVTKRMTDTPKFNFNAPVGNVADTVQAGGKMQAIQHNYAAETKQNLAEAAKEIQDLLYQLSLTNPSSTDVVAAVHQEIRRNPTLKARLISALKAGGLEALKAIFNHPLFSIPAETVKGWLEAE
jgi:uncharacterized protein YjbI with pentapeptide repeats